MVTTSTWERRALFRAEPWAKLLLDTIYHYRGSAYLLHEFVIMPDHLHILLTPLTSLEKAVQFIKGGFSYRVKRELGSNMEIWQKGFSDHRIRDGGDYQIHLVYMRQNPVRENLCEKAEDYPYSSANAGFDLDSVPQGLKPVALGAAVGAAKAAPFQSEDDGCALEGTPFQNKVGSGAPEGVPFQSESGADPTKVRTAQSEEGPGVAKVAPFQSENRKIA